MAMIDERNDDFYAGFREKIDQIDSQLLELLNLRASAALEIGRIKKANNQPIFVPEREKEVLERVVRENPGPLSSAAVETLFQSIIAEIRSLEESGPDGRS